MQSFYAGQNNNNNNNNDNNIAAATNSEDDNVEVVLADAPAEEAVEEETKEGENEEAEIFMAAVAEDNANAVPVDPLPIEATLDIEEDNADDSDGEEDLEEEDSVMYRYLKAIQDRLQEEVSSNFPAFQKTWLLDYLAENNWWIREYDHGRICKKLKLDISNDPDMNVSAYYRDVYVWLPVFSSHW